ncbi:MAG TPA: ABC transporter ATP-binding protein [Spirochaetes bacterium]|nr:ABC transporter ATP-binding protein [Spirochaetota bacterium]
MILLSIKNIVVRYGGVEALKGISLEIEEGSITTLIGSNGAGKSTCLKAVSGITPLSSGEIWFKDKRIDGVKPEKIVKMGVAHIPEGRRLFPHMSVYDNLMTGAFLRRDKPGINRDIEKAYSHFPILRKRKRQYAQSLSGGEQQMVAFGRGLLSNPKLFLFDEPSLGLAPILVNEVADHIKRLADEGYTVILVEQNANLALSLAKRAYVLELGKVTVEGDARELQNNEYVRKAYLGI